MVLGHDITRGQRTQDVRISEDISFDTMFLNKVSIRGLREAGFLRPSPVQLRGIPLGKCGFDLLLEAKSGTGKTAVFTIIALEKLDLKKGLQTIILAPTREIASQVSDVISGIGCKYKGLNVAVVMGGLPVKDDIAKFKEKVHIVVGSPGRLRHLIQDQHINVSSVRLFVLDEADKLMESSFLPDVNYIYSQLPNQKQVIMSSATYSEKAKAFVNKYVQKAIHVCPDSNSVLLGISQKVVTVPHNTNIVQQTKYRYGEVKKILNEKQFKQCLIFCNYQVRVGEVHRMLCKDKWPAEQLYGQQNQSDRLDALKTLQEYNCRILVSTDLAARGIDASNVDIVINFEPPYEWETYLHRIGRAGRYGSYGTAITILSEGKETAKFKEILAHTNIPFDLKYLWDDEPFDLVAGESNGSLKTNAEPVITTLNNESHKNCAISNDLLWKALTSGAKEKDNPMPEISSFEEICNAFNASCKPNIETFADLLDSFNTNNITLKNNEDSEYKHVEAVILTQDCTMLDNYTHKTSGNIVNGMDKKGKERYLTERMEKETNEKHIRKCETNVSDTKIQGSSESIQNNDKTTQDSDTKTESLVSGNSTQESCDVIENKSGNKNNSQHGIEPGMSKSSACNNEPKTIKTTKLNQSLHSNESHEIKTDKSYNLYKTLDEYIDSDEATNDPVKQALIDAGLPTAFGKKKPNRKHNRVRKYNHTKEVDYHEDEVRNQDNEKIKDEQPNAYEATSAALDIPIVNSKQLNNCNETEFLEADSDLATNIENNKVIAKSKSVNRCDKSYPEPISRKNKSNHDIDTAKNKMKSPGKTKDNRKFYKKSDDPNESDFREACYLRNQTSQFTNGHPKHNTSNKTKKPGKCNDEEDRRRQFDLWYSRLEQQTHFIQQTLYMEAMRSFNNF